MQQGHQSMDMSYKTKPSQKHKSTMAIVLQVMVGALGTFFVGYQIGGLNNLNEQLQISLDFNDNATKDTYKGILTGGMALGAIPGCIIAGITIKSIGRRKSLILADFIAIAGCGLMLVTNFWVVFIGRFIAGISVGINSAIVPIYTREISPTSIFGFTGGLTQVMINFGILVGGIIPYKYQQNDYIASENTDDEFYKFCLVFPASFCILRTFLYLTVYRNDTPLYEMFHDQQKATNILEGIYHEDFLQEQVDLVQEEAAKEKQNQLSWMDMFGLIFRPRVVVGICLQLFQQFSGINAVVSFSSDIFNDMFSKSTSFIMTIISNMILLIFSLVSGYVTTKMGRRSILILGPMTLVVSLGAIGVLAILNDESLNYVSLAFLFLYEIFFSLSIGPLVWTYNAETLPEKGVALSVIGNYFGSGVVQVSFSSVYGGAVGPGGTFFIFSGFMVAMTLFSSMYIVETKGLTSIQIERVVNKKYKINKSDETTPLFEDESPQKGGTIIEFTSRPFLKQLQNSYKLCSLESYNYSKCVTDKGISVKQGGCQNLFDELFQCLKANGRA